MAKDMSPDLRLVVEFALASGHATDEVKSAAARLANLGDGPYEVRNDQ